MCPLAESDRSRDANLAPEVRDLPAHDQWIAAPSRLNRADPAPAGVCDSGAVRAREVYIFKFRDSKTWTVALHEQRSGFSEGTHHGKPNDEDDRNSAGPLRVGETAENSSTCIRVLAGPSFSRWVARRGLAPGGAKNTRQGGNCTVKANRGGRLPGIIARFKWRFHRSPQSSIGISRSRERTESQSFFVSGMVSERGITWRGKSACCTIRRLSS
jgi:hypothetical protein